MDDTGKTPRTLPALATAFAELTAARTAPEAIRSMAFKTARRGFDPKEVSAYLDRLAGDVEILHNRIHQLQIQADTRPTPAEPAAASATTTVRPAAVPPPAEPSPSSDDDVFARAGARIASLMRTLEDDVRIAEEEAHAGADALLASARAEADELRLEARLAREEAVADAAAIVASARSDADRLHREAQSRADELDGAAQRTLREARSQAEEIIRAIAADRQGLIDDVRRMREELVLTLGRLDAVIGKREHADRVVVVETPDDARAQ